jgi:hypothetical protein
VPRRRWLNPSQPQTLQIAVLLLYIDAVFGILSLFGGGLAAAGSLAFLIAIGQGVAGYGIVNEHRWAYLLGVVVAVLPLLIFALEVADLGLGSIGFFGLLNLIFEVALVVLLVHPQSRDYQRIWFH